MTASANRFSTYTTVSGGSESKNGEPKKDLWSSMLDGVASGKRLPEKNLLVLGGTTDSQREFLEALSNSERKILERQGAKIPPVANSFALGYTYYDVLDTDQEDILARISLYLVSAPAPAFTSLIKPLLTPETIRNTLIVILLDWSQPHLWTRQLREWLLLLRSVLTTLSLECKEVMEEVMLSWRDRGRGGGSTNLDGTGTAASGEGDVSLPLGPGEWEDGLGLPLCVVCQSAEKMEFLEQTRGWKEADFDQVLQYLRTILLRHGASLIYTTPNVPSPLPSLIHSSLGITSLLRRQPLKHNVIDRDKILVPPNWDSWGKVRVLRDGFDVEAVSAGWFDDLDADFPSQPRTMSQIRNVKDLAIPAGLKPPGSAVAMYEDWVRDPGSDALLASGGAGDDDIDVSADDKKGGPRMEVPSQDPQDFLAAQLTILEAFRTKASEAARAEAKAARGSGRRVEEPGAGAAAAREAGEVLVQDHIGPVQFNMGGIQVDADDMLQRLKDRHAYGTPDPTTPPAESPIAAEPDTEKLSAFFTGLMNRGGITNSPKSSGA